VGKRAGPARSDGRGAFGDCTRGAGAGGWGVLSSSLELNVIVYRLMVSRNVPRQNRGTF
jgi:hypothetical protein